MRKRVLLAGALVLVVALFVAWRAMHLSDLALIGSGYTAQQMCDCLFVSHRTRESCQGDLEPLAQKVVSFRVGDGEVTATSLLISHATARYEKPLGCSLRD